MDRIAQENDLNQPPQRLAPECVLVVDDDADVAEAVALGLEDHGRCVVVCADTDAADMALEKFPVTHVISDVQFSGPFGFEGFHFLGRIHERRPDCRVALMTGKATDELRSSSLQAGASALLAKPFGIAELESALGMRRGRTGEPSQLHRVPSLKALLSGGALSSVFQPIVSLSGEPVVTAFESLARVRDGWPLGDAGTLFEYAQRRSQSEALNLACLAHGIAAAADLPGEPDVFLNVDPPLLESARLLSIVLETATRNGIAPERLVLEITERAGLPSPTRVGPTLEALRAHGVRFALDDVGSDHSHLAFLDQIRPSFMKISQTFGTDFETDASHERIVRHVVGLARDFGCNVILEGVETEATATAARALGIELGQGYLFGRPAPAVAWSPAAAI